MDEQIERITIPEVIERFREYQAKNPAWGSLHIVLDDGNVEDHSVLFCYQYAIEKQDLEGADLALLLLKMSKTQRLKLPHAAGKIQ